MEQIRRYAPQGLALLRVVFGLLFACHGIQKLFGVLGGFMAPGQTVPLGSRLGIAGLIELSGGVLVALGLFTRPLALLCCAEMGVAYFMVHAPRGAWPIRNGGELAVLYCFGFLYLFLQGGGRFSLDHLLGSRGRGSTPTAARTV